MTNQTQSPSQDDSQEPEAIQLQQNASQGPSQGNSQPAPGPFHPQLNPQAVPPSPPTEAELLELRLERIKAMRAESKDLQRSMESSAPTNTDGDVIEEMEPPPPPPSPTALQLDKFSIRRGKEWAKDKNITKLFGSEDKKTIEHSAADFLNLAWDPDPQLVANCEDSQRLEYISALLQSPEYESLHRQTCLDSLASEMAAASFVQQWMVLRAKAKPEDEMEQEANTQGACQNAMNQAKQQVQDLKETRDSLGIGDERNGMAGLSPAQIRKLFEKIRTDSHLGEIMRLAGRYKRMAQSLQASKTIHGVDEVVGIEFGNDLSRITVSELSYLSDEDMENDFLRRYAEGELEIEEMNATEKETKGPIVIVIDESGSMSGAPIANAKAMAIAMIWIAQHQKRHVALVSFSDGVDHRKLIIPPGQSDPEALVEWLSEMLNGGTDPHVPFQVVPEMWGKDLQCPKGKTDYILLTDAAIHVPNDMKQAFRAWKEQETVSMYSIIIGADGESVKDISDRIFEIHNLSTEAEGVADCLSI